jgi:uncharacterized SAM-binding protein YcdF (DUF218 family)
MRRVRTILHLGGRAERIQTTAHIARHWCPEAHIIFGTEADPANIVATMTAYGIPRDRYTLDYRAWDTLTNFTEVWDLLEKVGTTELYVVTDQYHIRRSMFIAQAVTAFTGITVIPCVEHTEDPGEEEAFLRALRDGFKALFWRVTGITLGSRKLKALRMKQIKAWADQAKTL